MKLILFIAVIAICFSFNNGKYNVRVILGRVKFSKGIRRSFVDIEKVPLYRFSNV